MKSPVNVFDKLYEESKKEVLKEKTRQEILEEKNLSECTFKPDIKKTEHNSELIRNEIYSSIPPKGYMENIVRLRKANEEKKRIKQMKDRQGLPQNYTGKTTYVEPFEFKTNSKKKRGNPAMVIEVTIAPGKTGIISIHKDDDPRKLADNFSKIYRLSVESKNALYKIILENMNSEEFKNFKQKSEKESDNILTIEEAKELEEGTSYNHNSKEVTQSLINNSKNSHQNDGSNGKINNTDSKNDLRQYKTPEQYEERMSSFNKESGVERSGFEEPEMVDGEDIAYSPDSSIRIPKSFISDDSNFVDRRNKFEKERESSIHKFYANANGYTKLYGQNLEQLEEVKEDRYESESKINAENYDSQMMTESEIVGIEEVEVDTEQLEAYDLGYTPSNTNQDLGNTLNDREEFSPTKEYQDHSPQMAYNYTG